MSNVESYLFCDHWQQNLSNKNTQGRHMALDQSQKLNRSLKKIAQL